ncbi:TraB/GumN family protein [soil metagenome]
MKRTALIFSSLFVICAVSSSVYSQVKGNRESASLLYKVTGNGMARPSYIFGTFHAVCPTEMVPFASLDTYLAQTDQLMLEIDMDDAVEMGSMGKALLIPEGKTLKDFLTAEQFAKVDAMTMNLLGYSAENVKMVKPSMLMVLAVTSPKAIGCTPTVYDLSLMQNAVAKKKPVVGLETVASQMKVLDSMPIDKQAKELYEMAANPEKSIAEMKQLMAVYKEQDPEKLFEMTNKLMTKDKEFQARLLDERNLAWIPKLETAFKEKPTFAAIGAGHLGGKNGVIRLLRKKGYKVTAVKL